MTEKQKEFRLLKWIERRAKGIRYNPENLEKNIKLSRADLAKRIW